jgi:hypothetical protein
MSGGATSPRVGHWTLRVDGLASDEADDLAASLNGALAVPPTTLFEFLKRERFPIAVSVYKNEAGERRWVAADMVKSF